VEREDAERSGTSTRGGRGGKPILIAVAQLEQQQVAAVRKLNTCNTSTDFKLLSIY